MSTSRPVPWGVPSLRHSSSPWASSWAEKIRVLPRTAPPKPAPPEPWSDLAVATWKVPREVPSVRQSLWVRLEGENGSEVTKKAWLPVVKGRNGYELQLPRQMSRSRWVPAVVPSVTHISCPRTELYPGNRAYLPTMLQTAPAPVQRPGQTSLSSEVPAGVPSVVQISPPWSPSSTPNSSRFPRMVGER